MQTCRARTQVVVVASLQVGSVVMFVIFLLGLCFEGTIRDFFARSAYKLASEEEEMAGFHHPIKDTNEPVLWRSLTNARLFPGAHGLSVGKVDKRMAGGGLDLVAEADSANCIEVPMIRPLEEKRSLMEEGLKRIRSSLSGADFSLSGLAGSSSSGKKTGKKTKKAKADMGKGATEQKLGEGDLPAAPIADGATGGDGGEGDADCSGIAFRLWTGVCITEEEKGDASTWKWSRRKRQVQARLRLQERMRTLTLTDDM